MYNLNDIQNLQGAAKYSGLLQNPNFQGYSQNLAPSLADHQALQEAQTGGSANANDSGTPTPSGLPSMGGYLSDRLSGLASPENAIGMGVKAFTGQSMVPTGASLPGLMAGFVSAPVNKAITAITDNAPNHWGVDAGIGLGAWGLGAALGVPGVVGTGLGFLGKLAYNAIFGDTVSNTIAKNTPGFEGWGTGVDDGTQETRSAFLNNLSMPNEFAQVAEDNSGRNTLGYANRYGLGITDADQTRQADTFSGMLHNFQAQQAAADEAAAAAAVFASTPTGMMQAYERAMNEWSSRGYSVDQNGDVSGPDGGSVEGQANPFGGTFGPNGADGYTGAPFSSAGGWQGGGRMGDAGQHVGTSAGGSGPD